MKVIRSVKLKITSNHPEFEPICQAYLKAANWLSKIVFQQNTKQNTIRLQKEFYGTVRRKFKIPSQSTCCLFRHVVGTYRSMKANGEWSQAVYKKPSMPMGWRRDFNISKTRGLTIWGKPVTYQSKEIPEGVWLDSKLKQIKGYWYLCLSVEIDVPDAQQNGSIVGVDSGQKNLLTAVNLSTGKTLYVKGGHLEYRRRQIRQTRTKVASVGTRSAYRLLKRLSGREKAVTQQICHLASKQVVAFAESTGARVVVMEDLTGIRKQIGKKPKLVEKSEVHHKQRARNNRWPFHRAQFFVEYKTIGKGMGFEKVDPKNTSRGCPRCGHIDNANRNGLVFRCVACDFADNADRVGATNIALRSLFQRQASGGQAACQPAYSSHEGSGSSELQASAFRQG